MHFGVTFILLVTFFWAVRSQSEESVRVYSKIGKIKTTFGNVEKVHRSATRRPVLTTTREQLRDDQTNFVRNDTNEERRKNGTTGAFEIVGKDGVELSTNKSAFIEAEARDNQGKKWRPQEEDVLEAADFGLRAMHDLYDVKEPKLYSMGLYLGTDNPAKYVAAFNDQTEEARTLAKFGYAVLEGATMFVKKFPDMSRELPFSKNNQKTRLQRQCPRRGIPRCPPASLRYRTSDGSCNNLRNPWWGSAMSTMQRFLSPVYDDGIQAIRRSRNGNPLPSARLITDVIHEDRDIPLASVTHMLMQWGQFVDHDLTATGQSRGFNGSIPQCCLNSGLGFQPLEFTHPECLPIAVDPQDSFFGRLGVRCLEFLRSGPAPREDCRFGAREQLTQVTSYLDASTVYSSNAFQSDNLRLFRNGLLQYGRIQSRRPLLPRQDSDLCKRGSLSTSCFRAGDGRLSEQPALTSIHVVFLRLHNRLATKLAALNPHWSDEKIFQETRKIVGAIVQHITYREFLPIVLGHQVMKAFDLEVLTKGYYDGYDPSINPTVANAFSAAAYRFGHSLVQHSFVRFDGNHRPFFNNVTIHDEFRNPENLETAGSVDRLLLGLVNQPSQKRDEFLTKELTRHLFQTPGFPFGMDLASLNIQRGRDHGIPPYVDWREPCGLSPIKSFADLERVMSASAAAKFRVLYSFVEDIDLYSAGLAENSVPGGLVGPTFACIIAQQFSNLRRGDRFWYENEREESGFTPGQLQQIRRITLSQVLCLTMDNIETVQPFVFLVADKIRNQRVSCDDELMTQFSLGPWTERPPERRSNSGNTQKSERKTNDRIRGSTTTRPVTSKQTSVKVNARDQTKILPQRTKPVKSNINQNNRIVVKKPFGPPDNVTIVVQNNAVNSPVFVNDAIYGSYIQIQTTTEKPKETSRPDYLTYQNSGQYNPVSVVQGPSNVPLYRPPSKPIPTAIPQRFEVGQSTQGAYVPYAYDDPSNPNPLNYGYRPNYRPEEIVYDDLSPTSPRPTLYTYYTHVKQSTSTQIPPVRQDEGYVVNHKVTYNGPSTPHYYQGSSPSAWTKNKPQFDGDYQYYSQKPTVDHSYPQYNEDSINRPGYSRQPIVPSVTQNEQVYSASPQYSYDRNKPTSKPYNQEESETWKYPIIVNKDSDFATQTTNRPYSSPSTVQDVDNYQNRPTNKPYNEDDPDIYYKKLYITTSSYINRDASNETPLKKPNDQIRGSGSLPNVQSYREEATRSPTLSNPDEWSSSYGKGPTGGVTSTKPQSNADWTKVPSYQANLSKDSSSSYQQQRQTVKPDGSTSNSFYQTNPVLNDDRLANDEGTSQKIDDISSYQANRPIQPVQQQWTKIPAEHATGNPRPTKIQSVSIVTESVETVRNPGTSGYRPQNKINAEIPRPLGPRPKEGTPEHGRKHGQYYYDKNVLHRYPENLEDGTIKSEDNDRVLESDTIYGETKEIVVDNETTVELNFSDPFTKAQVTRNDDTRFITTPTIVIDDDNRDGDLEGAFSENVASVMTSNTLQRTNYWLNSEEDPKLSSLPEMPSIASDEITNAKELPKPLIRSRGFVF